MVDREGIEPSIPRCKRGVIPFPLPTLKCLLLKLPQDAADTTGDPWITGIAFRNWNNYTISCEKIMLCSALFNHEAMRRQKPDQFLASHQAPRSD
jgi:hypothetical protein